MKVGVIGDLYPERKRLFASFCQEIRSGLLPICNAIRIREHLPVKGKPDSKDADGKNWPTHFVDAPTSEAISHQFSQDVVLYSSAGPSSNSAPGKRSFSL